jgi:hypothetical protein
MKRMVLSLTALGLLLSGLGDFVRRAEATGKKNSIAWDVAIDCRTLRFNNGISFAEFGRGDGFIANGKMFRVGTLLSGDQANDPNQPGSIGDWVERATMAATFAEIAAGTRPAFFATWYHLLADGSSLVADGPHPDSGPMAVTGGVGRFSGAGGDLSAEILGTNTTGCPNLRLMLRLEKNAEK